MQCVGRLSVAVVAVYVGLVLLSGSVDQLPAASLHAVSFQATSKSEEFASQAPLAQASSALAEFASQAPLAQASPALADSPPETQRRETTGVSPPPPSPPPAPTTTSAAPTLTTTSSRRPAEQKRLPPRRGPRPSFGKWRTGSETWAQTCKPYPGKRVVLVQMNAQYQEMFRNWLYHASRFLDPQTDQLVIAAESQATVTIMKGLSGLFGVSWDIQFKGSSGENTNEVSFYGTGVWTKVVRHRPKHILDLLEKGCSVLYQDVDTVWTRSGPGLFAELDTLDQHDMYIASDNDNPHNRYLCTGLMYYHPTTGNKQLMDGWARSVQGQAQNQFPFNSVLNSLERRGLIDMHVLSLKTFPPGKLVFLHNRSAVVLHANFLAGADEKVKFLRKFGYWNPYGTPAPEAAAHAGV